MIIYLDSAIERARYGVSPSVRAISSGSAGDHFLAVAGYYIIAVSGGRAYWGRR